MQQASVESNCTFGVGHYATSRNRRRRNQWVRQSLLPRYQSQNCLTRSPIGIKPHCLAPLGETIVGSLPAKQNNRDGNREEDEQHRQETSSNAQDALHNQTSFDGPLSHGRNQWHWRSPFETRTSLTIDMLREWCGEIFVREPFSPSHCLANGNGPLAAWRTRADPTQSPESTPICNHRQAL